MALTGGFKQAIRKFLRSPKKCVIRRFMKIVYTYRRLTATAEDIEFIKRLIAENPQDSRHALSKKLCKAWNWVQPNGHLRDMVCRGFMLGLHRKGYIELPPKRMHRENPLARPKPPEKIDVDQTAVSGPLRSLFPLTIVQVRRTGWEKLFNSLIHEFHYLGYVQPVGEHLKHMVFSGKRPVACLTWSSAPRHIGCRDRFIGWDKPVREKRIHLMAYNSRFLILPWYSVPNLGSYILSRMAARLSDDWTAVYNHPVWFVETFVDTDRFNGTSYRAANWIYLGTTTGRGKNDQSHIANRSIKGVWGYPLAKEFRTHLLGNAE